MTQLSRREFVALSVTGAVASRVASPFALGVPAAITAGEIVERIKRNIGVDWKEETVDTFKAGDPATAVTGVVVTSMATLDVLQRAVTAGANFVISNAPTFYSRADNREPGGGRGSGGGAGGAARAGGAGRGRATGPSPATVFGPGTGASAAMPPTPPLPESILPPPAGRGGRAGGPPPPDPVLAGKNAYIDEHQLVVFRLNEHWHARTPDPRAIGLAQAMGWTAYQVGDDVQRYVIPPTSLDALASQVRRVLGSRGGIRAIGDPTTRVQRVGLLPGFSSLQASLDMLPTVDVVITGEVQEWEGATYVQDVVFSGVRKGFISVGRVVSEAPGMQVCTDWLKTIVSEVPVSFISAGDPYWRP